MSAESLAAGDSPNYAVLDVSIGRDWPITAINNFHCRPRSSLQLQRTSRNHNATRTGVAGRIGAGAVDIRADPFHCVCS